MVPMAVASSVLETATIALLPNQAANSVLVRSCGSSRCANGEGQNMETRLRIWSSVLNDVIVIQ